MRKQKKYHYIYKITRNDGKYYIGLHSTDNLDDGYFGSGKRLWYSIKKYGKDAHTKEIIEFLPSREELKKREAELVNEECVTDPMCMNIRLGGEGGFEHINSDPRKREWSIKGNVVSKEKRKNKFLTDEKYREMILNNLEIGRKKSLSNLQNEDTKEKRIAHLYLACKNAQSESAKQKRKETMAKNGHSQGEQNSQFGTMWITNGVESVKIKKDDSIPEGWYKGRKISGRSSRVEHVAFNHAARVRASPPRPNIIGE